MISKPSKQTVIFIAIMAATIAFLSTLTHLYNHPKPLQYPCDPTDVISQQTNSVICSNTVMIKQKNTRPKPVKLIG